MRDRESNRKHGRFVSRFEHPCSTSPPLTLWRISTINRSHWITRCRNTYNEFTLELLGLTSPSIVLARTTHRKHTSLPRPHLYTELSLELETTRIASPPPQIQSRTLWWSQHFDHLKSSHKKDPHRIDIVMDSSSVCEKNKDWFMVKNSRNLFFKTLLKNSPFDMEVFGSKTSWDKHLEV